MLYKVPLTTSDIETKIAFIFNLKCCMKSFWVNRHTEQNKTSNRPAKFQNGGLTYSCFWLQT